MDHPRCKTCKNFDAEKGNDWDNPQGFGLCKMIAENWEMNRWDDDTSENVPKPEAKGHLASVSDGSAYRASLNPHPDFYCAMHSDVAPDLTPYSDFT